MFCQAEKVAAKMISEGRMFGSIDQLQAIVYFKRECMQLAVSILGVLV